MKHQIKITFLTLLSVLLLSGMMNAQTLPLNSFGIFPPGGVFNPNGKFTAIGESGGVPGPTANGCDLYGFRAQLAPNQAVNLGIQLLNPTLPSPTLSFESNLPLLILQQNAVGTGNGAPTGCGKVLGFYFDNTTVPGVNNIVYTIFGSGLASGGVWVNSDRKLKRNIEPVTSALSIVNELNGVTYDMRNDEYPELNLNQGRNYGFLVQDVKAVMPEAVTYGVNPDGTRSDFQALNYDMIIPVHNEAIKEQQEIIDAQNEIIKALEDRLARLENLLTPTNPTNDGTINIPDADRAMIQQNRPNPFSGVTVIDYSVPVSINNAQVVIYDLNGAQLKSYAALGTGSIEFDASALSSGIYIYALVANGQTLARQKMVVQ